MNESDKNPAANRLPDHYRDAALISAIDASGYPLQGIVADQLQQDFNVTEEWGYLDRDSGKHRSLDVFGYHGFETQNDVKTQVALLIECKRSIHPYVFFRNMVVRGIPGFPRFSGENLSSVPVRTPTRSDGSSMTQYTTCGEVLGLPELPFMSPGPPRCSAFAMATSKGDKVILSGTDPYESLILPLVKASDHASELFKGGNTRPKLLPTVVLQIAVLDAPMLVVNSPRETANPVLTPWVRIPRQEPSKERDKRLFSYYVIDAVHANFFGAYVSEHLLPFLAELNQRVHRQREILMRGAETSDLSNWKWSELRPKAT